MAQNGIFSDLPGPLLVGGGIALGLGLSWLFSRAAAASATPVTRAFDDPPTNRPAVNMPGPAQTPPAPVRQADDPPRPTQQDVIISILSGLPFGFTPR